MAYATPSCSQNPQATLVNPHPWSLCMEFQALLTFEWVFYPPPAGLMR